MPPVNILPDQIEFCRRLRDCFEANGLTHLLENGNDRRLYDLSCFMLEQNKRGNLTAITAVDGIIARHLADSLTLAALVPQGISLIDVGSGAGFPALPLAICRPDLTVTALEATKRKVDYMNAAAALTQTANFNAVCARAEEAAAPDSPLRAAFHMATARGVAELRVLSELCLPFVRVGGSFVAMKGTKAEEELAAAKKAIADLGGRYDSTAPLKIVSPDGECLDHCAVIVTKKAPTPDSLPRPYARILKKPL